MRTKFIKKMHDEIKDKAKAAMKNQDNINKTETLNLLREIEKSPDT